MFTVRILPNLSILTYRYDKVLSLNCQIPYEKLWNFFLELEIDFFTNSLKNSSDVPSRKSSLSLSPLGENNGAIE